MILHKPTSGSPIVQDHAQVYVLSNHPTLLYEMSATQLAPHIITPVYSLVSESPTRSKNVVLNTDTTHLCEPLVSPSVIKSFSFSRYIFYLRLLHVPSWKALRIPRLFSQAASTILSMAAPPSNIPNPILHARAHKATFATPKSGLRSNHNVLLSIIHLGLYPTDDSSWSCSRGTKCNYILVSLNTLWFKVRQWWDDVRANRKLNVLNNRTCKMNTLSQLKLINHEYKTCVSRWW